MKKREKFVLFVVGEMLQKMAAKTEDKDDPEIIEYLKTIKELLEEMIATNLNPSPEKMMDICDMGLEISKRARR